MTKVLMIVGSLRKNSFNRQLAEKITERLKDRTEVSFLAYEDVPFMNQDVEWPTPKAVARVRQEVMDADGIWIVTPEYNGSYPGMLKNLLDWLSRPLKQNDWSLGSAVSNKKVTISGAAGKSAAAGSRAKLTELLTSMRMDVMAKPQTGIALPAESFQTDRLIMNAVAEEELQAQVDAFLEQLQ